jgi:hypothetical protein
MFPPFPRPYDRKRRGLGAHSRSSEQSRRRAALRRRPLLEDLEGRRMLSTFTVTSTADTTAAGTLRWAITQAEMTTGPNAINFSISDPTNAVETIQLQNPLPAITSPMTINGLSQPGSGATSPLIRIDGAQAGAEAFGLDIVASTADSPSNPTLVSGLQITDFPQAGAFVNAASYVTLQDLFVGVTNASGNLVDAGNTGYGVEFYQGTHDTLGGSVVSANKGTGVLVSGASADTLSGDFIGTDVTGETSADQNNSSLGNAGVGVLITAGTCNTTVTQSVVSNNVAQGVEINGNATGANTDDNAVSGDFIGTDLNGSKAMPNYEGVLVQNGAQFNTVGGTSTTARNVISGNNCDGVDLGTASDNTVEGNYIGVAKNGSSPLGNVASGVAIYLGATYNTIGGTASGSGNVIGNNQYGVYLASAGTTGNVVAGNDIGVQSGGSAAAANQIGVAIVGSASGNTIGGPATIVNGSLAGAGNVISANTEYGVYLSDSNTQDNVVAGDFIGTDATGVKALPNVDGVFIQNQATCNTIGGTTTALADVISGNSYDGVHITGGGTENNQVEGDVIGLSYGGSAVLGNGNNGVSILASATYNTIGGTVTGSGDVIAGNLNTSVNTNAGVEISDPGTEHNVVADDTIGTNANGSSALGNYVGVLIQNGATYNTVGGTSAAARDVISGNSLAGVQILGATTMHNVVEADYIGLSPGGSAPLANNNGVLINGAGANTIGGTAAGDRDFISGNALGVNIFGTAASLNVVEGDYIGTDATGTAAVANVDGVVLQAGAVTNEIGTPTAGSGNVISGNIVDGVLVLGAQNNYVWANTIGLSSTGAMLGNGGDGVQLASGASGNMVGAFAAGYRNIISGNTGDGVDITGSGTGSNGVDGNYIGTDATGSKAMPNYDGVVIENAAAGNAIIGTAAAPEVISGNNWDGVHIVGGGTKGNFVQGVDIGTNAAGTAALANVQSGVAIYASATNNTIGGTGLGAGDVLSGNGSNGVYISDSGTTGNVVEGDFIGTDATGSYAVPNYDGVVIQNGASGNTIGAPSIGLPSDVISGNNWDGVHIVGSNTGYNVVEGDYIGTNFGGTASLPNCASGVAIYAGANHNTIGGTASGAGDVVSGNTGDGFYISGGATNANVVAGDFIGTDYTGSSPVANNVGVYIGGGATNSAVATDVISGNTTDGVQLFGFGTAGNVVEGDDIGVNAGGTAGLGNHNNGVSIYGQASFNTIGGIVSGSLNVISDNTQDGVSISDSGSIANLVAGNDIGTNSSSSINLGNYQGVVIQNDAAGNTIGGTTAAARNVISGNNQDGVHIVSGAFDNTVEGDYLGTNVGGTAALGNGQSGVAIYGGANNNTIGGTASGVGDVLSGNGSNGVFISDSGTKDNVVASDFIGTDATGSYAVPNFNGVLIENGAGYNTIGAVTVGTASDVISGNNWEGVHIANTGNNVVEGDYIGLNVSGTASLKNAESGVGLYGGATGNTIGGSVTGAGDVISGNGSNGVYITDSTTTANQVAGDVIGLSASQSQAVPNHDNGVFIGNAAYGNIIGRSPIVNVISGNDGDGVLITGSTTNKNIVQGNTIGTNSQGASGLGNGADGVLITGGSSSDQVFSDVIEYNDLNGVEVDANSVSTEIEYDTINDNLQNGVYLASGSSLTYVGYSTIENNNGLAIKDDGSNDSYNNNTIIGSIGT